MRVVRRRGFAMIAAIGILAILALIVIALGDSHVANLQIKRHWSASADARLATQWAMKTLNQAIGEGRPELLIVEDLWGNTPIEMLAAPLDAASAVYGHPALSPRDGDYLVTLTIGESRANYLVRSGARATHHRLPAGLIPQSEELN